MGPADVEAILDAAKAAAHNVEHPAAPVTTYLMGYAVARGADALGVGQIVDRLAQEFDDSGVR